MKYFCKLNEGMVLISTFLCALLTTGCDGNSDTCSQPNKQVISFSPPIVSGISRTVTGVEFGGKGKKYPKEESFRVFASRYIPGSKSLEWNEFTDKDGFQGDIASYDDDNNAWATEIDHYWVDGMMFAFRAFSPSIIQGKVGANGIEITDYTTPSIENQFDMMYSTATCDVERPKKPIVNDAGYNGVNLMFRHALSSIHFKVCISPAYLESVKATKRDEEIKKFKINKIKIAGVYNKAGFKENATITKQSGQFVYTPGTPQWTIDETSMVESPYEFLVTKIENVPNGGDSSGKDIISLDPKNHIGFMIPQKFSNKARIVVEWEYDEIDQISTIFFNNEDENDVVHDEWKVGLRYTYTIALSKDRIYFDPNISQQGEGSGDLNVE